MWKPIWIDAPEVKLDDKDRSDRALSITPNEVRNGREEVGLQVQSSEEKFEKREEKNSKFEKKRIERKEKRKKKFSKTKITTKNEDEISGRSKKSRLVKFYGKIRPVEEVERIKPLIVGRRINADSWKLYEWAVEKLSEKGILVAETREMLELMEKIEKPLVGRKLLKLIKFLYAQKFHRVDLKEKPTIEEVLSQPSVEKLDLGGWGRYAFAVYEVLLELGLIDETTEVRFPEYVPVEGYGLKSHQKEGEIENLLSLEEEVSEYWELVEEIEQLEEEEQSTNFGEIEPKKPNKKEEGNNEFLNEILKDWFGMSSGGQEAESSDDFDDLLDDLL
jgi:hypothetical protein